MYSGQQLVGYTEIMYYTPYYMNENAFQFLDSLNMILVATGIVSIIAAVITGMVFAGRITAPIHRVIERTKKIAEGDFTLPNESNVNSEELYELSRAVTAMSENLDRQEKLRQRLTGNVAHELRTPLTNIASHLEMMCEGIWQPTPERLESCYEEIQRISGLVDDMEKLHRIDAEQLILKKTVFDIKLLIENTVSLFENETSAKGLIVQVECGDISVHADRDRIAQVVTNLLSNAVKYTENDGHIRIIAENADTIFRFTVNDTGRGISPEDLPQICERFYRADKSRNRSTGGSGVGLAVVKAIVDAHGGNISAKSEYRKGSTASCTAV